MTKRDIKFRYYDDELKQFITWDMMITPGEIDTPIRALSEEDYEQYTGLKDFNGVEIYEGDILSPLLDSNLKFVIEFKHGAFIGTSVNEDAVIKDASLRYLLVGKLSVIIGNVHENTELLD